jgi:hypothetical protein
MSHESENQPQWKRGLLASERRRSRDICHDQLLASPTSDPRKHSRVTKRTREASRVIDSAVRIPNGAEHERRPIHHSHIEVPFFTVSKNEGKGSSAVPYATPANCGRHVSPHSRRTKKEGGIGER